LKERNVKIIVRLCESTYDEAIFVDAGILVHVFAIITCYFRN